MILQMCSEQKGFDLVSRKAEFEVIKSEDLELPLSDSPPMNFDTVVENGLLDIASEVSKAFKSNQDMETSLRDDIVLMHNLFDDYHPKDSLRKDNFIITGNLWNSIFLIYFVSILKFHFVSKKYNLTSLTLNF